MAFFAWHRYLMCDFDALVCMRVSVWLAISIVHFSRNASCHYNKTRAQVHCKSLQLPKHVVEHSSMGCCFEQCHIVGCCIKTLILQSYSRPQISHDYPLNLSILLSGGKETNRDSPSNGE
jgi:hypothetical protein